MVEHKCIKCGKLFIPAPQHMYRDSYGMYCSWTCYNHRDAANPLPLRFAKPVEQCSMDGELIQTFPAATVAAEIIKGTVNNIRCSCRNNTPYKGYLWRYKS